MRLQASTGVTDPGRKRRHNEDAYVLQPPLFAVADGMGGAQAGEIASHVATAALRDFHEADELDPEQRVAAIIQEANRRVYERAQSDTEASGMGTTCTVALLEDERLAIGHVGDSRAYRLRGGRLEQLTEDHSLVADLIRSGRLSPEEAEAHPQRSVITRALGTDSDVDVDSFTVDIEPGDVFMLCSDGLTTMVADDEVLRLIEQSDSLESAGKALIKAANKRGGDDNVTVVLFAVAGAEEETVELRAAEANGPSAEPDLEDTLSGLEAPPAAETVVAAAVPAPAEKAEPAVEGPPPPRPKRRLRRLVWLLVATVFLVAVLVIALWALSRAHFIGAEQDGHIAVYQGLPWELTSDFHLYRARYISQLQAVQLSAAERAELLDHDLVSYGEARRRLARLESEGVP